MFAVRSFSAFRPHRRSSVPARTQAQARFHRRHTTPVILHDRDTERRLADHDCEDAPVPFAAALIATILPAAVAIATMARPVPILSAPAPATQESAVARVHRSRRIRSQPRNLRVDVSIAARCSLVEYSRPNSSVTDGVAPHLFAAISSSTSPNLQILFTDPSEWVSKSFTTKKRERP
jgi:hypothetical protein